MGGFLLISHNPKKTNVFWLGKEDAKEVRQSEGRGQGKIDFLGVRGG